MKVNWDLEFEKASSTKNYPIGNLLMRNINLLRKEVKPIKGDNGLYSATKTLDNTDPFVKPLIRIWGQIDRSKILGDLKTDRYRYYSLTPVLMYLMREEHNIKYSQWDRSDPKLIFFLGKFLQKIEFGMQGNTEGILEFESRKYPSKEELKYYRQQALTVKKTQELKPLNSYKPNNYQFKDIPIDLNYILLQTWIANAALRVEESMILDWWDWDNIPKAYDTKIDLTTNITPLRKENSIWDITI